MAMHKANTIDDLDFLPLEYQRQRHSQGSLTGSIVVTILCVALLLLATALQLRTKWKLASQLAEVTRQNETAIEQTKTLARLQEEKNNLDLEAELLTYLRRPWPRSAVLVQIAEAVPESTVLTALKFHPTKSLAEKTSAHQAHAQGSAEPQEPKNRFATDLETLQGYFDGGPTLVTVEGLTQNVEQLHAQFLRRLNEGKAFEKAELQSVERESQSGPAVSKFRIELALRQRDAQASTSVTKDDAPPSNRSAAFSTSHVEKTVVRRKHSKLD